MKQSIREMASKMLTEFDMAEIGYWMMEAIPDTLSDMESAVLGELDDDDIDGHTEEDVCDFYNAFWLAVFEANSTGEKQK